MAEWISATFNNPLTEEQWDMLDDVDFDKTEEITFYTKNGKKVVFVKRNADDVRPVKWIPVTERLPEETGFYLVWMLLPYDETHVHAIINYDADCEAFGEWEEYYDPVSLGWAGSDFIKIENVYAWMPLPEPPEGGADG